MDLPCKFSDKGCKQVGDRNVIQAHLGQCIFGKFECPHWPCKEMVTYGEAVEHLKNTHDTIVVNSERNEIMWKLHQQQKDVTSVPILSFVHGRKFILNGIKVDNIMMLWVTVLGTEEEAQTLDVIMTAGPHCHMQTRMRGKVYSIEKSKEEVLQDPHGILEISNNMAGKMGEMEEGEPWLHVDYDIIRKEGNDY